MRIRALLLLLVLTCVAGARAAEPRCYLASRSVLLSFDVGDGAPVDRVEAWVTTDNGKTWNRAEVTRVSSRAVRYEAHDDGTYGFFLVLINTSGRSADPPRPGTVPQIVIVVDTEAPVVQIHGARQAGRDAVRPALRLDVSLIEEHLGSGGVRVFYRAAGAPETQPAGTPPGPPPWHDGGVVPIAGDVVEWPVPDSQPAAIDLRLVATDLAGNRGSDEIFGVPTTAPAEPLAAARAAPTTNPRPALAPQTGSAQRTGSGAAALREPGPEGNARRSSAAGREAASQPAGPSPGPAAPQLARARALQQQARRFLAEGKFALAGARLEQALRLVPGDADLHVDLGGVFFRNRQYDEARREFARALETAPDHARALEDLALVEAVQNRYASARAHLRHLLRVEPRAGRHWLHFGDVEHMLGHAAEARAAWQQALRVEPTNASLRQKAEKRLKLFGGPTPSAPGPYAAGELRTHAPSQEDLPDAASDRRDLRR